MKMIDMKDCEYFKIKAFSNSAAKLIRKSPKHFMADNFKGSSATRIGTAVHAKLLTPDNWDEEIVVYDQTLSLNSKAGRAFIAKHPDVTCITEDEATTADLIVDTQEQSLRDFFRGTVNEMAIIGEIEGIPVKCKVDAMSPAHHMYDIKTTANMDTFISNVYKLGYYTQAAWYLKLARLAGFEVDAFYFWVVETSAPYCSRFVGVTEDVLEDGLEDVEAAFQTYKDCYLRDDFTQGYSSDILMIDRPAWRRHLNGRNEK